jgi:hypothetical protein
MLFSFHTRPGSEICGRTGRVPAGQDQHSWGQQPPPYGGSPPGGYYPPPPPKKKAKWPWILGGILVAFLLLCGGCFAFFGGISNEIDKASKEEATVTYEVTSDGPRANNISYSSGGDGVNIEQANQQALPWTKEVTVTGFLKTVSLTAQADEGATTITCKIREGDKIIAEQTSTGPYAVVSCSGGAGE